MYVVKDAFTDHFLAGYDPLLIHEPRTRFVLVLRRSKESHTEIHDAAFSKKNCDQGDTRW